MTATTPAVDAAGLGRDYGATRALDALDLGVPAGTICGLVGPNGAGKTTTLLLLGTLLSPSRGTARVLGFDIVRDRAAVRRRIGLVFQEPSLDPLLTVGENLVFAGRLSGLHGAALQAALARVGDRLGLSSRMSQPARQLSGGWRRLVDLGRALLHQPDLLILDEPTVGLDPEHRERAWQLLEQERRDRGATIVFSTHYLLEAETCDRVVLLSGGRAVGADTPSALKATIGDAVLEIEGADAERLVPALAEAVDVRVTIRTERGFRIGIAGARDALARVTALAPGLARLVVRPATLDDVYFARTQAAAREPSGTARPGAPA